MAKQKWPFLSVKHHKEHMDFAIAYKDWTLEDWKKVIWFDKTKINYLGSDGRKWAWKKSGERLSDRLVEGTLKFGGGSLMMWGCICWQGPGYATKIDRRMDGDLCLSILKEELQETFRYYNLILFFSKIMIPSTPAKKSKHGLKTRISGPWSDQHNPLILIP